MEKNDYILLGSSIKTFELDDEEELNIEDDASRSYDFLEIIDSIKTNKFKENYLISITEVKLLSFDEQLKFCNDLLLKFEEKFDFTFPQKIEFNNKSDLNEFYNFLEFIHFNYIEFFGMLWIHLGKDIKNVNINEVINNNFNRIDLFINKKIDSLFYNKFINLFLRTYDKLNNFLIEKSIESKMQILLYILERTK